MEERSSFPLPPATFEFLVLSLKMQAEMHMGTLHFGEGKDRPAPDLPASRHAIDLLGMIEEKTRGNLSMDEKRLIENSLTELRFRYVQAVENAGKAAAAASASPAAGAPEPGPAPEAGAEGNG